jgi:cytochrome c-type biogenesis protein CcmH
VSARAAACARVTRAFTRRKPTAALACALALTLAGEAALAASAADMPPRTVDAYGQLQDPALQNRFERIVKDLRCLVCQNESIADSNVELAADLRRQVREMLIAGQSDDAIFRFMTDRYGEFVRFNPPLEPKTLLIWGAPFIILILGAGIVFRVVRQRSRMPLDDEPSAGPS